MPGTRPESIAIDRQPFTHGSVSWQRSFSSGNYIVQNNQGETSHIAVTGANGFIGRQLCTHLSEQQHQVRAIVRAKGTQPLKITQVVQDLAALAPDSRVFEGCDVVVHLAGRAHVLHDEVADPLAEFRKVNVELTRHLIADAARCGVKRFVFVSSIGVNGNASAGHPFTEKDAAAPHDLYAISKHEAEQMIRELIPVSEMQFVIVRPTLVFGPDAPGNFSLLLKLAAKSLPLPFGRIFARRSLLSIWNLVDFLQVCATHPAAAGETFLVSDEQDLMLGDIFRHIGTGMGKKQYILPIPAAVVRGMATLCGKKQMYAKLTAQLLVDTSKARSILGWRAPYNSSAALERAGREYISGKMNETSI